METFRQWHQALAYALLGAWHPELGEQPYTDPAALAEWFSPELRSAAVCAAASRRLAEQPWPFPLPAGCRPPAAQFSAALQDLRARLGLLGRAAGPVEPGPRTAAIEALLREAPPHYGR